MIEIWKPIKGYEGYYEVSNLGRVKALKRTVNKGKCHRTWEEHYLKYAPDKCGYIRLALAKDGINKTFKVHRLVADAFIDNPDNKEEVNHIDGDRQNNRVENLEWCTRSENIIHAYKNGLIKLKTGENNPSSKLTWEEVNYIRKVYIPRHKEYGTIPLSKRFNVHKKTISRIVRNEVWKEGGINHVQN